MKNKKTLCKPVLALNINPSLSVSDLIDLMANTGFQGRRLADACKILQKMIEDENATIFMGYSGSLSVAGQWKIVRWLIDNNFIDVLVSTGANISEDIVEAMGNNYYLGDENTDDEKLFLSGINRYYNVLGKEKDYIEMTELIADFILTLDSEYNYSSREFLYIFGLWLHERGINSIITTAALKKIPIYCPAISDSPYGDASLIAKSKGFNLKIDSMKDYSEFMGLSQYVSKSGAFIIGGGVPKDFIQLFAVTPDLMYENRNVPNRLNPQKRKENNESYYPHEYAIQIMTDFPQWGGLSGCTFDEAVSWGKETKKGSFIQCFCDATIALPIMANYISQKINITRKNTKFSKIFF